MTVLHEDDHDVAYLTDVEGMWPRLASFCADNPLVAMAHEDDATPVLTVRAGATFVFGGDAIDRGPRSRKIVRTLLEAKKRQPDQVILLGGNRDLNKLRLVRELDGAPPKRAPEDVQRLPRAQLLQWIFKETMGAAEAFEHRRSELAVEQRPTSDDDVAQSYLDDLAPGGDLARYLDACQLAYRSGQTLFVHGGLAVEALTVVPGTPDSTLADFDVDAWIARLERFYRLQMAAFAARIVAPDGTPAWENAILYQAPKRGMKLNPGSVVYGRIADDNNNMLLPAVEVVDALVRTGITRVVIGHTPSGDTPSIVRCAVSESAAFEIVNCDNSRSRVPTASQVFVRDSALTVRGNAVLDDGSARAVAFVLPREDVGHPVGKRTDDGDLVKAPVHDGWLVFRYLPKYEVTQRVLAKLPALHPVREIDPSVDKHEHVRPGAKPASS